MRSTRDRFQDAISGAPSIAVAAGVVTAMHLANCKELLDFLQDMVDSGRIVTRYDVDQLREEYTAQ